MPEPSQQVIQVAFGYIASAALNVAVELGIAERLAGGPRPVAKLAGETSVNEDALHRTLRLLSSLGIFTEGPPRTFANTPASETLRAGGEGSVRDLVRWISDPLHFQAYAELMHSVKSGERVRVEITLDAKNHYEYLVVEDWKPAGCEAVELKSGTGHAQALDAEGYRHGSTWLYREFRDQKAAFLNSR